MIVEQEPFGPQLPEGNHISQLGISTSDLEPRLPIILTDVFARLENEFHPNIDADGQPIADYSRWWGKKAGAAHIQGIYRDHGIPKPAILRIEGAHIPAPDEWMLPHVRNAFTVDGDFVVPELLWAQPWTDDHDGYSVSVIEAIDDTHPLFTIPPQPLELDHFFTVWRKYRAVIDQEDFQPWIQKPTQSLTTSIQQAFTKWRQRSEVIADFAHRSEDAKLIDYALHVLQEGYKDIAPVFMHTHFGKDDIVQKNEKYVFRANLYWDFKAPFYDAVFAYHWAMLELANDVRIPEDELFQKMEEVRQLWRGKMDTLATSPEDQKLLKLALLERAAAGLLQDVSLVYKGERREVATQFERDQIQELVTQMKAA